MESSESTSIDREPARAPAVECRYRASTESVSWRRWGDEVAVHESRSAETHLLAGGHAELFDLLATRAQPLTLLQIAGEFADNDAPSPQPLNESEMASLQALLDELAAFGLVESVTH